MTNEKETEYGVIASLLLKSGAVSEKQVKHAERIRQKLATPTTLVNVLKDLGFVSDDLVRKALVESKLSIRIGELLVELGYISNDDLTAAFNIQKERETELKLGEILVKYNFIDENLFNRILSIQLGFPLIDVNMSLVDKALFDKVPIKIIIEYQFIPIKTKDDVPLVVFGDPLDKRSIEIAGRFLGGKVSPAIAEKKSLGDTIKLLTNLAEGKRVNVDGRTAVGIVNSLIVAAIKENSSDIHIEPQSDRLQVRFREDGVLYHHKDFPMEIIPTLTSRIKIMCGADIAEKRRHQGGRILFDYDEGSIDIRVSFYITIYGENIVFRLLKQKRELLDIQSIGLSPNMLAKFLEEAVYQPSGVLLVTGPTGSGKTSTIYSCINHIKNPQISIITAEEPVEYVMEGIAQCSIDPSINMTFDETLRHIVRQDPDVIVIGEIRDQASAEMAMQSALTGHKVLTTFHTEDSIGGLIRLLNMDIAPFLISSTIVSVLAQRLLRRVCDSCARDVKPTPIQLQRMGISATDLHGARFRKGRGCTDCKQTGYKGRVGVFELLVLNELVRDAILDQKTSHDIRQISIQHSGLITLLEDGLVKAAAGTTTIEEILRCLPKLSPPDLYPKYVVFPENNRMQKNLSFLDVIKQHIEAGDVVLPVLSSTAMRVQKELVKEEPDVKVLERLISTDQSLSSQVLQMANSAFYHGLVEVMTIRAAIVRLGMQEVGQIALLAATKNQFQSKDKKLNVVMRKLWQHSVGCALGGGGWQSVANWTSMEAMPFFAGLFHDIGKLFVLMVIGQLKEENSDLPLNQALLAEAMDVLHTGQGYGLLKRWNLPEDYCVVARDHHNKECDSKNILLQLVRLSDKVCIKVGVGLSKEPSLILSAHEEAYQLNLTEIDLAELEIFLEDTAVLSG